MALPSMLRNTELTHHCTNGRARDRVEAGWQGETVPQTTPALPGERREPAGVPSAEGSVALCTLKLSCQSCSSSPSGFLGESSIGFHLHQLLSGPLVLREAGDSASGHLGLCLHVALSRSAHLQRNLNCADRHPGEQGAPQGHPGPGPCTFRSFRHACAGPGSKRRRQWKGAVVSSGWTA